MNPLETLLRSEQSELVRLARAATAGLVAALETGLSARPADPAAATGRAAVEYLRSITGSAEPTNRTPPSALPETGTGAALKSWVGLRDRWVKARDWSEWFGGLALPEDDLARRLWLLTHRLPPDLARDWKQEWLRVAGTVEDRGGSVVAGPFDGLLCPPLSDGPGAVRMSGSAPSDPRFGSAPTGEIAGRLARVASVLLWYTESDPGLRHMLRALSRFGTAPVPGPHQARYQKALCDRFEAVRRAEDEVDLTGLVVGWADFDEAAQSLTFDPPPHSGSVFASIARASRDVLGLVRDRATAAGLAVHFQVPAGRYADCRGLTEPEADIEAPSGAAPGDIVRCVRVFVRLGGVAHPGRVLYRPR